MLREVPAPMSVAPAHAWYFSGRVTHVPRILPTGEDSHHNDAIPGEILEA